MRGVFSIASIALVTVLSLRDASAATQITQAQAVKIALARVPGTAVHEKLKHSKKKKKKDKHDHWNIKITPRDHARAGYVRKVEIDAETGEILKIKDVKVKSEDD